MRPVQIVRHEFNDSDSADNFFGVYFSTDYGTKQAIDFYVYYRDKNDNQPNLDPTNRVDPQGTFNGPAGHYATLGARTKNTSDKLNGWDYCRRVRLPGRRGFSNRYEFAELQSECVCPGCCRRLHLERSSVETTHRSRIRLCDWG